MPLTRPIPKEAYPVARRIRLTMGSRPSHERLMECLEQTFDDPGGSIEAASVACLLDWMAENDHCPEAAVRAVWDDPLDEEGE